MAEVYTVVINNETPTEITGGRVGHFKLLFDVPSPYLGGDELAISYEPHPQSPDYADFPTVVNGWPPGSPERELHVTSPDRIFVVSANRYGTYAEWTLHIFHNR